MLYMQLGVYHASQYHAQLFGLKHKDTIKNHSTLFDLVFYSVGLHLLYATWKANTHMYSKLIICKVAKVAIFMKVRLQLKNFRKSELYLIGSYLFTILDLSSCSYNTKEDHLAIPRFHLSVYKSNILTTVLPLMHLKSGMKNRIKYVFEILLPPSDISFKRTMLMD